MSKGSSSTHDWAMALVWHLWLKAWGMKQPVLAQGLVLRPCLSLQSFFAAVAAAGWSGLAATPRQTMPSLISSGVTQRQMILADPVVRPCLPA